MAKGYWITSYRSVSDPAAHSKYAALAGSAITAFGGRFLARGMPFRTFEAAPDQRCVVIESIASMTQWRLMKAARTKPHWHFSMRRRSVRFAFWKARKGHPAQLSRFALHERRNE